MEKSLGFVSFQDVGIAAVNRVQEGVGVAQTTCYIQATALGRSKATVEPHLLQSGGTDKQHE